MQIEISIVFFFFFLQNDKIYNYTGFKVNKSTSTISNSLVLRDISMWIFFTAMTSAGTRACSNHYKSGWEKESEAS